MGPRHSMRYLCVKCYQKHEMTNEVKEVEICYFIYLEHLGYSAPNQ